MFRYGWRAVSGVALFSYEIAEFRREQAFLGRREAEGMVARADRGDVQLGPVVAISDEWVAWHRRCQEASRG